MSDMQFEYLPNEILIECFRYLSALQIFQSFDRHNYRFNQLIRSIKLHLDFENIPQKLICDTFSTTVLPDQEIKNRIDSIHLSNENISYPIQWFLSIFSFNQFVHLRSLTLTKLKKKNLKDLKTMLPSMTELFSFRMINCDYQTEEILCTLPLSQLRTLIIPKLPRNLKLMDKASSITNLTISFRDFDDLSLIFNSISKLKYLKIENIQRFYSSIETKNIYSINNYATYLNKLIITKFRAGVDDLFILLKQTPNLRSLTINALFNRYRINADEWEDLINSSLSYLSVFKFNFEWEVVNRDENEISDKLKQFQSDFWCKQHHWYTEYILSTYRASIYTIPYAFDSYSLKLKTNRYSIQIMNNNVITFDNVEDLTVDPGAITEEYQYRFSYVTSLTFQYAIACNYSDHFLRMEDMKHLKIIVNLSHVKHLSLTMLHNLGKLEPVLTEILK
ncbi:unnamed protein product [Adineta steineri]|uniref:F-box domain-containing protein n=1 Tax=Adineta steineri TaxID=433720 RepID=A0A819DAW7_9BILA|nr:unnamed protein product [Adineta steineri]CAF3834376.1 unnamed protein product [Adineta steineri]